MKTTQHTTTAHNPEINGLMESRKWVHLCYNSWLRKPQIQEDCQIQNTRKSARKQSLPEMATYTKSKEGNINGDINTKGGNFHGDAILRQNSTGN